MINTKDTMADKNSNSTTPTENSQKGSGMDRNIKKEKGLLKHKKILIAGVGIFGIIIYFYMNFNGGQTYKISGDRILVSEVKMGKFEDFIPVRGRVIPA